MKDIFTVLGKKNGKNAVSLSSLKKDIRELESFLEDHHVECRIKIGRASCRERVSVYV